MAVVVTVRARGRGGSWDAARPLEAGVAVAPARSDVLSLLPLVLVGLAGALTQNGAVIITLGGLYLGVGVAWLFRLVALGGWQARTGRRLLVRHAPLRPRRAPLPRRREYFRDHSIRGRRSIA